MIFCFILYTSIKTMWILAILRDLLFDRFIYYFFGGGDPPYMTQFSTLGQTDTATLIAFFWAWYNNIYCDGLWFFCEDILLRDSTAAHIYSIYPYFMFLFLLKIHSLSIF